MNSFEKENTVSIHMPDYRTESIHIDENGKASDMSPESIMSGDGCNPVNKDEELQMAHDDKNPFIPAVYPGTLPGSIPGTYNNMVVPAYFPGVNLYNSR